MLFSARSKFWPLLFTHKYRRIQKHLYACILGHFEEQESRHSQNSPCLVNLLDCPKDINPRGTHRKAHMHTRNTHPRTSKNTKWLEEFLFSVISAVETLLVEVIQIASFFLTANTLLVACFSAKVIYWLLLAMDNLYKSVSRKYLAKQFPTLESVERRMSITICSPK